MAETSHGNGYLEGVKSRVVFLAQTHFPTVKNYYSMQVKKGTAKERPGIAWEQKPALFFFFNLTRIISKEHRIP